MNLRGSRGRNALLAISASFLSLTLWAAEAPKRDRAEYDALATTPRVAKTIQAGDLQRADRKIQIDDRLALPTFVWAGKPGVALKWDGRSASVAESAARRHLEAYGELYRLSAQDVASARLAYVHNTGNGAVIAKFRQQIDGVDVFRDELAVLMDRQLRVLAISGYLASSDLAAASRSRHELTPEQAVARALTDFAGAPIASGVVGLDGRPRRIDQSQGGYQFFTYSKGSAPSSPLRLRQPVRAKPVWFHFPSSLEPAYYVEVEGQVAGESGPDAASFSYVISALDGRVLFRHNLTATDSFSYRVWADTEGLRAPFDSPNGNSPTPHPTGIPDGFLPPFLSPNLVTLESGPISTGDPWLPPGASVTTGNNVDAYADLVTPDGFSAGDFRADTTSPNSFDRTYDVTLQPGASADQRKAAITQLFYDNNYLHDWFYDFGFDEASGNAQENNYGRGGIGGDSIRAEAQDFSGVNNANMNTPADGGHPRMQMYVFSGPIPVPPTSIIVNAPAAIAGSYTNVGTAAGFGAQVFDVTQDVVWVDDGVGTGAAIHDGCETPFANAAALAGKIAFIDRGGATCAAGFLTKAQNAAANGAVGVIIANIASSANPTIAPGMAGVGTVSPLIGVLSLNLADGNAFRAQFGLATVNARLVRPLVINRDGDLDNQIVAHEWGHYISNRLIGNAAGLTNTQGRGMGEGWGDFTSMLLSVKPEDVTAPGNETWNGVYAMAGYASIAFTPGNNTFYFGIRRVPYSTDFTKDPLTFTHITNGVPLPVGPPYAFGASGANNAEVHNVGEVWASMLWESYAALLRDTLGPTPRLTFDEARNRMLSYVVGGYKMTPNAPTITEARDAVLATAYANDPADFELMCQAFATRGAGIRAVPPDRFSTNNAGVVESYVCGKDIAFAGASLDDSVASCDQDGVLDNVEIGKLTVTLKNVGNGPLNATTATVTSSNPHVSFPDGNEISFPASSPFDTPTASVNVELEGAVGIEVADFAIAIDDPDLTLGGTSGAFLARVNTDEVPESSATEDVEASNPAWTRSGDPSLTGAFPWRRLEASVTNHRWLGPNAGAPSDQYLISPVLNVASHLAFTFRHRYSFEAPLFDGGVIEISANGGPWTDIGSFTSPGYNGTLVAGGTNPLRGRQAFVNNSAGYPNFINATVDLGSAYDGQNVQIRFRTGADDNSAAVGWEIDDIAFTGITNTPFTALVAHQAACNCPAISLTPTTLPTRAKNVPYPATTLTPTAGSGPFDFTVSGLPAGMTPTSPVSGSDVTIGGTPTVDFNNTVNVSGGDRFDCPFNQNYSLVIAQPTITINDPSVSEGNAGFPPVSFTVSLSYPSAVPVQVIWSTADGTAEAGKDYKSGGEKLTIPALATSGQVSVQIKGDTQTEPNETFFVRLKKPVNASIADSEGVCTILNDD